MVQILREVPLDDRWDVVVVGGGPAGCTAAASAAREGARTLLIEATGCLGGMGTSGLLNQWMSFTNWTELIIRGMAEHVFTTCRAGIPHAPEGDCQPIDTELLKRVYDDLVTGHGAEVRFNTRLAGVELAEPEVVSALLLANKAGLQAVRATTYVDCTGDGDLAAWAGAAFAQGDEHGEVMPTTLCFALANVDMYAYAHGPALWPTVMNAIFDGHKYADIPDHFLVPVIVGPGVIGFNAGHQWGVDAADPRTVSRALLEGRRTAKAIRDALAEYHPRAFGNAYLVHTAELLGVRESRRIVGDYTLTVDDYYARASFSDEICRNAYCIDIHPSKAQHAAEQRGETKNDTSHYESLKPGETHGIPYRCLTPRDLRNVLVAGRCISTERPVQGAVRIMPVCLGMGEAAGLAAALSTGDVHAVDTRDLTRRLRAYGAYLPGAE
jgi:hypothetical protein